MPCRTARCRVRKNRAVRGWPEYGAARSGSGGMRATGRRVSAAMHPPLMPRAAGSPVGRRVTALRDSPSAMGRTPLIRQVRRAPPARGCGQTGIHPGDGLAIVRRARIYRHHSRRHRDGTGAVPPVCAAVRYFSLVWPFRIRAAGRAARREMPGTTAALRPDRELRQQSADGDRLLKYLLGEDHEFRS